MVAPIKPIGAIKPVLAPAGQSTAPATDPNAKPPVAGQPGSTPGAPAADGQPTDATQQTAQPKPGEKVFNITTDKDPTGEFTKVFASDEQHAQQVYRQQGTAAGQFKGAQLAQESIDTMVGMLAKNGIEEGRDYYVNGTIYTDSPVMAEDITDIINMQDWDKKRAVSRKHDDSNEYYVDLEGPNAMLAGKTNVSKFRKSLNICREVLSSETATSEQKLQAKRYMDSIKKQLGTIIADSDPVSESTNTMTDKVHFNIDSERAYQHVMDKFGQAIEWDGDTMVVARHMWPAIEELALAAGGAAEEDHGTQSPDVDEAAPGIVRHAAGAALGALSGIGGAVGGHMLAGPLGAVAGGAYGAKKGHELGSSAADAVWDKFSGKKKEVDEAKGDTIEAHGARGMKQTPWRRSFKDYDALNRWVEANDSVEVHATRDLDQAKRGNLSPAVDVDEAQNDYFKRRKDEEDRIAGTKAPAKRTPKQTDYEKKRKEQAVDEGTGDALGSIRSRLASQGYTDSVDDRLRDRERYRQDKDKYQQLHHDALDRIRNGSALTGLGDENGSALTGLSDVSDEERDHRAQQRMARDAYELQRRKDNDEGTRQTMDMFRDRLNRMQYRNQRDVDPAQIAALSNIRYEPRKKASESTVDEAMGGGVDAKGRTQAQWMKLVKAKFPDAKMQQAKMIDGPCQATLSDGRKLSWNKVEQGVAEGSESGAKILYTGKDKSGTVTISYEPDYIPGHSEKYIIRFDGKVKSEMPTLKSAVYGLTHYQFDTFRPDLQPNPKTVLQQGVAEGEVAEAKHGLNKRVRIVSGPADCIGKIGTVGEVRSGPHIGAEKTYTVDYDYDGNTGRSKSVRLKAKDLRLVKDDIAESNMDNKSTMTEGQKVKTKTGMIHKGTYGSEVDVNDDGSTKKKAAPKSATGKRGRPAKADEPKTSKSNDPFGRVPDKAPKGKKGTVVKGKATKDDNLEEARETLKTAKGTIYKGGTYGTSYDVGDDVKKAPANKNPSGQRGRPKKDDSTSKSAEKASKELQSWIVGSVPKKGGALDKLPKTKHKIKDNNIEEGLAQIRGLKKQITETIRQVQRLPIEKQNDQRVIDIVSRLEETVSKAVGNVLRESHETMAHILSRFPAEVKQFAAGGELDDGDLYDALFDYYLLHGEMPYGIAKARTGDPLAWVSDRFAQDVGDHYETESVMDEASGAHMFMTGEIVYFDNQRGKVDRQEGNKVFVHTGNGGMDVFPADQTSLTRQGMIPTMKKNLGQIGRGIKGFMTSTQEESIEEADDDITVFEKEHSREELDAMSDDELADLASTEYSAEDMLQYDDNGALANRGEIIDVIMSYNADGEVDEGNQFSGALQKAKSTGQQEFDVDGKTYKVKEATPAPMADMALESLATMIRLAGLPKR